MIAALPMYDWPERRDEVDAEWTAIRDRLRNAGIHAPEHLTRVHDDLLDFWKRPDLLFGQTCWGPMELGLSQHVQVVGQPSYDGIEGGQGELYSSAIVMRVGAVDPHSASHSLGTSPPFDGGKEAANLPCLAPFLSPVERGRGGLRSKSEWGSTGGETAIQIPLNLLRNARFAYNVPDSMSGIIGLTRDLATLGETLAVFSGQVETGGHRKSIRAVAEGRADVAAIDCRSWHLAELYEPAARELQVVGWTALRKGLPFITAKSTPPEVLERLKAALT